MSSDSANARRIQDLLMRTSRTFALAIPLLPAELRLQVSIAYLLFRVADTVEDAPYLSVDEKLASLTQLQRLLSQGNLSSLEVADWLPRPPCDDQDCLELLDELPLVVANLEAMPSTVRQTILESVCNSMRGMVRFLEERASTGHVELESLDDLQEYCYCVAGIVGEMLSDLFLLDSAELQSVEPILARHSRWFGEGLQLVNILKDSEVDAAEGRRFIPASVDRMLLFDLARRDFEQAEKYVAALKQVGADDGIIAFTEVPLKLAWRTLDCVEQGGPGSKVSRAEVMKIVSESLSRRKDAVAPSSEVASKS